MSKTNACFVLHLYSSNMTEHVHMYTPSSSLLKILDAYQGYISIPDTGVTFITLLTHEVFSISLIFVSFNLIVGKCLYNSSLLMYFPILGAELITESFKNHLIVKCTSASRYFGS